MVILFRRLRSRSHVGNDGDWQHRGAFAPLALHSKDLQGRTPQERVAQRIPADGHRLHPQSEEGHQRAAYGA